MVSLVILNWETQAYLINDVAHPTYALQQDLLSWLWNYTFDCCLFRIFPWFFTSVSDITCSELNFRSSLSEELPHPLFSAVSWGARLCTQWRRSGRVVLLYMFLSLSLAFSTSSSVVAIVWGIQLSSPPTDFSILHHSQSSSFGLGHDSLFVGGEINTFWYFKY